ncbi:hypothetical protein E2N92_07370 [Methanofollis formosanus]|uniref:Uncharacterized protein n=1 Tax=Methanofollis formosanus TaxID=299308 RepID=A0A8G1A227_9EURY|nr:hypothetical protein [Methanofollis formosanus]QYZ79268.1 hypothetical protein E2N92_07370 [Methanofollis formosanus]
MANPKKDFNVRCCIGIPMKFGDHDFKVLRIADISTKEWSKKGRVNTIGTIYTNPDNGNMLIPIKLEENSDQWWHDNLGIWMWKESTNSEAYDVAPYSHHPKPPCKYNYYELIFLQNPETSPESIENMRIVRDSDDALAQILEKGIVVPDTFSENLLVVYDCDEDHYFCVEITKATSCLRYNELLFVTDRRSLDRYRIKRTDVIDSFDPVYKNSIPDNGSNLTRRFIYKKMKFSQQDKLETLTLRTDSTRFAGYFYRIASRLNYSEDEKKLVNRIVTEALSNPKLQPSFILSPEIKQWLELQTDIINAHLNTDDKVEGFVKGVIENVPKINKKYISKIQHVANQGLFEQKESLEIEIGNLKNTIDEINGEILVINAEKTAETDALKSLKKTVESEGERLRSDQDNRIKQELQKYKEDQKKIVDEEIALLKKEQMQVITKEGEQFRVDQQKSIQKDLESLHEEARKIQKDIDSLEISKKQLEKEISETKHIQEECSRLEQKKQDLEKINDQLKTYCEQKLRIIQHNPGDFLGDLALFKGVIPSGECEQTSVASSPNSGLFVQPAKDYDRSDLLESTNIKDLIDDLKNNLQNIGVDDEYAENLAKLIAGAYLTRKPLLLTGCKANIMANAISVTLHSQTPEVISVPTGYNDYSSLLNAVKNTRGNVVLLQNAIGSIDEYCYTHLAKDILNEKPEKYILFSLDFAENMRILPPSILGYMILLNSEDLITSIATEALDPGICTVTIERNPKEVKGLYQRVVKLSNGLNTTNGYNLTRTAILSVFIETDEEKDEENVEAVLLLELVTYCKLLGATNELNQRLEHLSRENLKIIVKKLLGGE